MKLASKQARMYQSTIGSQLTQLWLFRGFILSSVSREFQAKYSKAVLGAAWAALSPLAMVSIYMVIFGQVLQGRLPGQTSGYAYGIYLCAGILTWGMFSEITLRGQTMFLDQANLIKKVSFPRICLPAIVLLNASINFAIIFGLFTCFLIVSGNFPGWVFLALFPVLAIQMLFALALGVVLGVLNVFFRDVAQFFVVFLQFWFWLTPIVYPSTILPNGLSRLLVMNPMAAITAAYQTVLVNGTAPQWPTLLIPAALTLAMCVLAARLFSKRAGEMVDEL